MRRSSATTSEKIGYASGNLGKNVVFGSLDFFLLFFLTEVWGLPPAQAGLIILIALVWDGVADPAMGVIVDRTSSRFGRYGPYLLLGAPICAAAFCFVFYDPGVRGNALAAWSLAATMIFRTAYTVCDVPHNALLARVTSGEKDAAFVSGARFVFSSAGGLLIGLAATHILHPSDPGIQSARFSTFALGAACVFLITIWLSWFSTRGVDPRAGAEEPKSGYSWRALSGNSALLWLFAAAFLQAMTIPIFAKCLAYFGAFSLNDAGWSGGAIVTLTLAQAASVPLWVMMAHRVRVPNVLALALVCSVIGSALFLFLSGTPVGRFGALILVGMAIGGISVTLWALLPAAISQGEARLEVRAEALSAGLFLLMLKAGSGVGAGLLGLSFQHLGIGEPGSRDSQSGEMVRTIMSAWPIAGALACLPLAYILSRSTRE